ncbi:MAG: helix-turn-helix transcriptional regulator, partial [Alloprevotella sp.]|nr:helix-turn-helix transcriptional regulator [Alloprevotella sp.]
MTNRLQLLVKKFADGRNTRFASLLDTNEARIRSYLTGTVLPKYDFLASISERLGVS